TAEMGSSPSIGTYAPILDIQRGLDPRGRNHWPQCWTALLAGAGVTGGLSGASDKYGAYPANGQPVSPEIFGATVYEALGIPPETLLDPANPLSRINTGEPLLEVFR